ncbi:ABC transporter ATP-binding protein/permease [Alkalihalophilus marmarensis]|uniref:ABC transporter ATP-binding protein n=1 Tax=Alkalihalophilus marmarensis TaxID=521377 RepID=UPI0020419826|nr:ABC transporter ATP-binding protein [Alkalihalophilus marmarensis]MCM3489937.1 ABC transporter ATP-binding protein/permease [Alkalihalophilus marmarensis]
MEHSSKRLDNEVNFRNVIRTFEHVPKVLSIVWRAKKSYFIFTVILYFFQGLNPIISIYLTQELINSILIGWEFGFRIVLTSFLALIAFIIFREMVSLLIAFFEPLLSTLVINEVDLKIMHKSNNLGLADFENAQVQDQLHRANSGSGQLMYQLIKYVLSIMSGIITILSSAIFLALWIWWIPLLLFTLPLLSLFFYIPLVNKEYRVRWERAPKTRESWYLKYLLTHDQSFKEVKLYKLGNHFIDLYNTFISNFYKEDKNLAKIRMLISTFFMILNSLTIGVIIFIAIRATYLSEILIGNLVAYIQSIVLVHSTAQTIIQTTINLVQNNLQINQLFLFLDLETNDPLNIQKAKQTNVQPLANIDTIEFKNVSFCYPGSSVSTLKNISFKLSKGETLAIVGKNGSGKSTLVKLITQLYVGYSGEILINGTSIDEYNIEDVRNLVGILFQDYMQYQMSVRQNVGFGNLEQINNNQIINEALHSSGLASFFTKEGMNLDQRLGKWFEDGEQLSGGQWQRVAIARAYVRKANIYILDEPSSALDPASEKEVFSQFNQLIEGRMGIFITHRFSTVKNADKILVLDCGEIVESGSHKILIDKGGIYNQLYNAQLSSYL